MVTTVGFYFEVLSRFVANPYNQDTVSIKGHRMSCIAVNQFHRDPARTGCFKMQYQIVTCLFTDIPRKACVTCDIFECSFNGIAINFDTRLKVSHDFPK